MRWSLQAIGSAALIAGASAQTKGNYCDELGRCFSSYTLDNGIVYGVAIPEVTAAPFPAIIQITAPIAIGWAGFGWGGGMTYKPLTVAWPNGDATVVSSRKALSYSQPSANTGATLRLLDGSYVNETHWVTTAVCEGCSSWDLGTGPSELDPTKGNTCAFAYSETPVSDPSDEGSSFGIHDSADLFGLDFASAQSPDFDDWVGGGGEPSPTPTDSPTPSPTTTPPTDPPIPTGTVPIPTDCGEESLFPLEAAEGWSFVKLAGDLTTPRGVVVDVRGSLLIVEVGSGLSVHTFGEDGCIAGSKLLIDKPGLTHGVTIAPDNVTLYVSSVETVWKYTYDADARTVSNEEVVVQNMFPGSHSTRTLLVPPATPDLLVVSLGSDGNLDMPTIDKSVGRAVVKVFDMSKAPSGGYDYNTEGWFLGYGLRNEVGLAVDNTNMIWGVENSGDDFNRVIDGVEYDIHQDNPADEINYLGDPSKPNENWYGYPTCFTVWGGDEFPNNENPATGSQFIPAPNDTWSDTTCEERAVGPRLSFQAHSAPIDAKFDETNSNLFVSLHGSWNRDVPTGYKVVAVPFNTSASEPPEPAAEPDSKTGYKDILWDTQEDCDSAKCFRPSGLSWDRDYTHLFVASDNGKEGELYILYQTS